MWRYAQIQRVTVGIFCSEAHFASRILRRSWISDRIRYILHSLSEFAILSSQDTRLTVIRTKEKGQRHRPSVRKLPPCRSGFRGFNPTPVSQAIHHPIVYHIDIDTFAESTLRVQFSDRQTAWSNRWIETSRPSRQRQPQRQVFWLNHLPILPLPPPIPPLLQCQRPKTKHKTKTTLSPSTPRNLNPKHTKQQTQPQTRHQNTPTKYTAWAAQPRRPRFCRISTWSRRRRSARRWLLSCGIWRGLVYNLVYVVIGVMLGMVDKMKGMK